jgi:Type II CAAX prenyl endopeptidase Rce1-like
LCFTKDVLQHLSLLFVFSLKLKFIMKKDIVDPILKAIKIFPENIFFLITGTIILTLPMIATIGQFLNTGYFQKTVPILLLYWPGSDFKIRIQIVIWFFMGLIFISYLAGIAYMFNKRTLGKVILITISAFICSGMLRAFLTWIFGWHESPLPDLTGKADSAILSQWHNPIWEEIVFRGIPLLILLAVEKYITKKRTNLGILIYCIVPSVVFGFYHIPGHGMIRFFDTILLGIVFSWLALRYTFFAPVVMHYVADAMIVLSLIKIPTVQSSEVEWLLQYGNSLNSFFFLLTFFLLISIPVLLIYYYRKIELRP